MVVVPLISVCTEIGFGLCGGGIILEMDWPEDGLVY